MSIVLKRKLFGLWRSRTHWGGLLLGVLVGSQPYLMDYFKLRLTAEDYALAGVVVYGVINLLRWVTTEPLEEKGK